MRSLSVGFILRVLPMATAAFEFVLRLLFLFAMSHALALVRGLFLCVCVMRGYWDWSFGLCILGDLCRMKMSCEVDGTMRYSGCFSLW